MSLISAAVGARSQPKHDDTRNTHIKAGTLSAVLMNGAESPMPRGTTPRLIATCEYHGQQSGDQDSYRPCDCSHVFAK